MKYIISLIILLLGVHIHAQTDCATQGDIVISSATFEVVNGPINNFCGPNGTLEMVINLSWAEQDPNATIDLRFELEHYNIDVFDLVDVTGVDSHSTADLGATLKHTGLLELHATGAPNNFTYAEIRFVFNWTGYAGFNYDYWLDVFIDPNTTPCREYYWQNILTTFNIQEFDDYFFIENIVEPGTPPLSQRTTTPIATTNPPFPSNLQVQDDFEVDDDFTMTASNNQSVTTYLIICDGKTITVSNNSTLSISNYDIQGSNGRWSSIVVEDGSTLELNNCVVEGGTNNIVIEEGGTLIVDDVVVKDASQAGITLENNSSNTIENTVVENCQDGLKITGTPTFTLFQNNTFRNNVTGVRVLNSVNQVNLTTTAANPNYYLNNHYGFVISNGSMELSNSELDDNFTSIFMRSATATEVHDCKIGFITTGVNALFSEFFVYDNLIGTTGFNTGRRAFYGISNKNYEIRNNTIEAIDLVSFMFYSKGEYDSNVIGLSSTPTRGLHHVLNEDEIADNDIYNSHTNLLLNAAVDNVIEHNELLSADYGIFNVGGTTSSSFDFNIIDSDISGIRFDNSGGNTTTCNEIDSDRCVWVNRNSDIHHIKTNDLDGNNEDVYIESVIGIQDHHANLFYGEHIEASGLTAADINNSIFKVDQNDADFVPTTAIPTSLLLAEPFAGNVLDCNGNPGNSIGLRYTDTSFVCTYLDSIEVIKNTDTKLYWNKVTHFMKYVVYKIPLSQWPLCVKQFWLNEDLCGIKEMVNSETDLKKYLSGELVSYENVSQFRDSLIQLVNTQNTLIENLECTEQISQVWIDTYLLLSKRIVGDSLTASERTVLDSIASLCAYEYGDAVHWARSLMLDYSTTDYYVNDNCSVNITQREGKQNLSEHTVIDVYPNPAQDLVTIKVDDYQNLNMILSDVNGRLLYEQDIEQHITDININFLENGLYLISIRKGDKHLSTQKLIKQ